VTRIQYLIRRLAARVSPRVRREAARRAAAGRVEREQKDIWGLAPAHPESMLRQLSPLDEARFDRLVAREWPADEHVKGTI
jgi:hypothetical protein